MKPLKRCLALLCVAACATVAAVSVWPNGGRVRTEDRDGDGRPDVWRHYDNQGQVTEIDIDTNFDGRSDIQEYYHQGALLRRESDRNFNDQIDLVEEFDETTHEQVRSVVDSDFNGTADLLVLFQHGQPVFSKWISSPAVDLRPTGNGFAHGARVGYWRTADETLVALMDPFRADTCVTATHDTSSVDLTVGLSTSGGLPRPYVDAVGPRDSLARVIAPDVQIAPLAHPFIRSPRGPPLS